MKAARNLPGNACTTRKTHTMLSVISLQKPSVISAHTHAHTALHSTKPRMTEELGKKSIFTFDNGIYQLPFLLWLLSSLEENVLEGKDVDSNLQEERHA